MGLKLIRYCLIMLVLCAQNLCAQNDYFWDLPGYKKLLHDFYQTYEVSQEHEIAFIKKPAGWYLTYTDTQLRVPHTILFRRSGSASYAKVVLPLRANKPDAGDLNSLPEFQSKLGQLLDFERCAYYGYDQWSWDVINAYAGKPGLNERELESLGRAYASYANGFLEHFQYSFKANAGSIYRQEVPMQNGLKIRLDSFVYYEEKCITQYKKLVLLNPDYHTLVGNIRTKLNNEYVDIYLKLRLSGAHQRADSFIHKCNYPDIILNTASNYLNGLPKNSILFTNGDNDTYPLWYIQAVKGQRQDVAVINTSLLGINGFVQLIADATQNFETVTADPAFLKIKSAYLLRENGQVLLQNELLPWQKLATTHKTNMSGIPEYPAGNYYIAFNGKQIVLQQNPAYIYYETMMLNHLIEKQHPKRQIYFTEKSIIPSGLPMQNAGITYCINPKKQPDSDFDPEASVAYFSKGFQPLNPDTSYNSNKDRTVMISYGRYLELLNRNLLEHYAKHPKDSAKRKEMFMVLDGLWADGQWRFDESMFELLKTLYSIGLNEQAQALRTFVINAVETELPNSVSYDEVWYLDDYQRLYFFDYYIQNLIDTLEELNLPEEKAAFEAVQRKLKP